MNRGMLRYAPLFVAVLLLVAAGPLVSPVAAAASSSATPASDASTATTQVLEPTAAAVLTAEATAYPTPDPDFPLELVPRLQAAHDRLASPAELREVAYAFTMEFFRVGPSEVFVCEDNGPVVVNARPAEGFPWYSFTYLFWRGTGGKVQYQALDHTSDGLLSLLFAHPPEEVSVSGGLQPEIRMVVSQAVMGQDWGGGFYLLRLEGGAWRVVWSYGQAVEAGLWATRGAQAQLLPGDAVLLRGAVPEAEDVPRFFDEAAHKAYQQEFISLWDRRGDEYVRTLGTIVETPMRALTEFMVGLTGGDREMALRRAADPSVVDEALAQGWADVVGADVMAWSEVYEPRDEEVLQFGPPSYWGGSLEAPYSARLVLQGDRWLVAGVKSVPPGTARPFTPEPSATVTPIPPLPRPAATATPNAAFADSVAALSEGQPPAEVERLYVAEALALVASLVDPARPLGEQREALAELRASLPSMGPGQFGEGIGQAVPADLDESASPELLLVAKHVGLPMLYLRYRDGAWLAAPVPFVLPGQDGTVNSDMGVRPESARSLDMSADGRPEALVSHLLAGASNTRELLQVLHWNGAGFDVYFRAELVDWAGDSRWMLGTDLKQEHIVGITISYPYFFATGFEAKMVPHPRGLQSWAWDATAGRYTLQGAHATYTSAAATGGMLGWDYLRVLANQAEESYQAGDLRSALDSYTGYYGVVAQATEMVWPAEAPNWPAYALFRGAEVQALLGDSEGARAVLDALAADLSPDSNLLPLVESLRAGLDATDADAPVRAVAALHSLRLYETLYRLEDAPGDLTFPINATTILWAGTPLALDLQRHLWQPQPPNLDAAALLGRWSGFGFPVVSVAVRDVNGDDVEEVLVVTDESEQDGGSASTWLLTETGGAWWRGYRLCASTDVTFDEDGSGVARCGDAAWRWDGTRLTAVDPETLEPPWPVVGRE